MTKVSIIVPVYNVEKYLEQCLDSLTRQTLQDIEIICVNDGSTDDSLDILKKYEKQDSRIRVISKKNTGYGNSMNVGLQHAKGEYIGIVESDDFVDDNMFEALYQVADRMKAEVVKSNFYIYINGEDIFWENLEGTPYMEPVVPVEIPDVFKVDPSVWSALYRRDFIEKENIRFHETPGASYQDVSFAFEVMCKAKCYIGIKEAFLHYRSDNANSSMKAPGKVFCIMDEFHRVEDIIEKNKIYELQDIMIPVKYRRYLANFYRMGDIYQYAFLYQMYLELKRDYEKGLLDKAKWTDLELKNTLEIIRVNYEEFFKRNNAEYMKQYVLAKDTKNDTLAVYGVHKLCKEAKEIIIYGAGKYAEELYGHIRKYSNIVAFAVSDKEHKNVAMLHDIPVVEITELVEKKDDALVMVALSVMNQVEIVKRLKQLQFRNIVTIDSWIEKIGDIK